MDEEFTKLILVPFGIALFVFVIEMFTNQAKGTQHGNRKFKLWLNDSKEIHPESPKNIDEIKKYIVEENTVGKKKIVDITELPSIDLYAGFGFDLMAAAITTDILALFGTTGTQIKPADIAGWLIVHLISLLFVSFLVRGIGNNKPDNSRIKYGEEIQTVLAISFSLFCVITSFVVFWKALQ